MVERYTHLSPDHLRMAVEKLVEPGRAAESSPALSPSELDADLTSLHDENPVAAGRHSVSS